MRNWMIACACALAWGGVAGCSGNSAAGPADPGTDGPSDPAPGGGTPAEEAFDNAHGDAEAALAAARAAQDADGGTPAEEQDLDRWSARAGAARAAGFPEVHAVRRIRSNAAGTGDNPNILKVTTHPAVPYEAGKVLISEGEAASGDMLPMWGFGSDRIWSNSLRFTPNYNRGVPYDNTVLDGYVFLAALRITPAGLVMEIGGRGADGMDLRRVVGIAPPAGVGPSDVYYANDPPAADPHGWDLILTFGEPASSPEGNGEAYWAARLMPDPGQIAAGADADTRAKFLVGGRPYHIGTYKLWLSNHAGAETNLEPADGGSYPDDDENTFLKYAAYGIMIFESSDRFVRSTGSTGIAWREIRDRVSHFHVGYDAFEDEDGKRTTNIGEAVKDGKFAGFTIALEIAPFPHGASNRATGIDMRAARRLRGDVELTATISGTAADNSIAGMIRNLEVWDSGDWKDYASIPGDITLASASIGADGHYVGTIERVPGFDTLDVDSLYGHATGSPGHGGSGRYFGALYGPAASLETAGVWHLAGTSQGAGALGKAVVGSFGAKLPPSE